MTQHLDDNCEFGGSAHIHDVKKNFVKVPSMRTMHRICACGEMLNVVE